MNLFKHFEKRGAWVNHKLLKENAVSLPSVFPNYPYYTIVCAHSFTKKLSHECSNSASPSRKLLIEIRKSNIILKILRRHGILSSIAESNISTLVNQPDKLWNFLYPNTEKKLIFVKLWVDPVPTMCKYLVVYENLGFVAYGESGRILSKNWRTMCTGTIFSFFHKSSDTMIFITAWLLVVIQKIMPPSVSKWIWKYNRNLK